MSRDMKPITLAHVIHPGIVDRASDLFIAQPVAYGVITADNTDQAIERAGNKMGNKGFQAAQSAIELLNLFADAKI